MDEAIRALAEGLEGRIAIVALGGYGREELAPRSDIDLMVLHAERRPARVREAAERLFYPLWDAGLDVGHAVRTVREAAAVAKERLDAGTAMLDARLVAGDERLGADLDAALRSAVLEDADRFLAALRGSAADRRERFGSCAALLEPDLKESGGGLRDLQTLGWAARVADPALLGDRERRALDDAHEFLVRLRSALHLETGRRADRVHLDHQPSLARAFGFEATAGLGAADALMRALFEHARQVEHLTEAFFARALDRDATSTSPLPRDPDAALEVVAAAAEAGASLPPAVLEAIVEAVPEDVAWSDRTRAAFLRILRAGARKGLDALDRVGVLASYLPAWGPVRCRPQRDPYHRWSVDVHLLETVAEAARILAGATEDDPVLAAAVAAVPDADAVLLGALLHDIGKVGEGRHVEIGARVAGETLERMGIPEPTRGHAVFLVAEHLLLADTATRRDLTDENLVLDVASRVGDTGRLAMLCVLTAADAAATGPHAASAWRRALVRELVGRVERALEGDDRDAIVLLGERMDAVGRLLEGEDRAGVVAYLDRVPRPYLLAVPPEVAARHFRLVAPPLAADEVRTEVLAGERPGTYELAVVAPDRPGLLAMIAGALALAGLNILSAQAFTTEDGVAIDLFTVEGAFEPEVGEDRWRRMRTDLRRALEGRVSLEHRVHEKRRHYPAPAVLPVEVALDDASSDFSTVVEVSAPDRIGLLFDIATALHEAGVDVHVAKVATYGARVVDAFYVRDAAGRKLADDEQRDEVRRAILARLGT